jgi:hypothetical protein
MRGSFLGVRNFVIAFGLSRARDWICQILVAVVMALSTLTTGCTLSMASLPPGIPKAQVRQLCWTPAAVDS